MAQLGIFLRNSLMRTTPRNQRLISFLLFSIATMAFVRAQNYDQVAPKEPPKTFPSDTVPKQKPKIPNSNLQSEAPKLNGIILLSSTQNFVESGWKGDGGVQLKEVPFLDDKLFAAKLRSYLNQPITSKVLELLARDIVLLSQSEHHGNIYVMVPNQNVESGNLQVLVLEKPVGKIEGERGKIVSNADLFKNFQESTAKRVSLEDFYWINQDFSSAQVNEANNQVLVDHLKGLIFMSGPEQVKPEGVRNISGIRAFSFGQLRTPEFASRMEPFFGKPVSINVINQITREVILYFRQNDRPVVDVYVPEQDITSGVVQVVVVEGRLGKIKVEGNKWFTKEQITAPIHLKPEEYISEKSLTEDLNYLNSNPFRQTTAAFTPGSRPGYTDLILKTQDRFPIRPFVGYDNTGNDLTGDERVQVGFNWGNAFDLDHQMSYQMTSDLDYEKLVANSGSYMIPLPWRHRLTFFGSYARTLADIDNPALNLVGNSWQVSMRYAVPLPTVWVLHHEVSAGYDFKQSNNNLEFGGTQVFNTVTEVDQFVLDYTGSIQDKYGINSFDITGVFSPGGISGRNNDELFNASRVGAQADYMYGKFSAERLTKLPWDFSWDLKASAQVSSDNLLGSEQFGLGGYATVRGYDEREANGDEGYWISTEIRSMPLSFNWFFDKEEKLDQLQLLAFFDYGGTQLRLPQSGGDPHVQLASVGPGIRYAIGTYATFRFDYGFQLMDTGLNARDNSRGHIGVTIAY